jgi:hypothetical protein
MELLSQKNHQNTFRSGDKNHQNTVHHHCLHTILHHNHPIKGQIRATAIVLILEPLLEK